MRYKLYYIIGTEAQHFQANISNHEKGKIVECKIGPESVSTTRPGNTKVFVSFIYLGHSSFLAIHFYTDTHSFLENWYKLLDSCIYLIGIHQYLENRKSKIASHIQLIQLALYLTQYTLVTVITGPSINTRARVASIEVSARCLVFTRLRQDAFINICNDNHTM